MCFWGKNSSLLAALNLLHVRLETRRTTTIRVVWFWSQGKHEEQTWEEKHLKCSAADAEDEAVLTRAGSAVLFTVSPPTLYTVLTRIYMWFLQLPSEDRASVWALLPPEACRLLKWTLLLPCQNRLWAENGATEETAQLAGTFRLNGFPKKEVKQLWKQNSTWPWKVNSRCQPKSSTLRSETFLQLNKSWWRNVMGLVYILKKNRTKSHFFYWRH